MPALRWLRLLLLCLGLLPIAASAWDRGAVQRFATIPDGSHPEGLTVDQNNGDVYATSFIGHAPGRLFVFGQDGHLKRQLDVAGASGQLLGLDFNPATGDLLIIDFGAGKVLKTDPFTGATSVFTSVGPGSGLNALTFDKFGNVYISDSFQGIIWKTPPNGTGNAAPTAWITDPLLTTTGTPPFGANGLGFNKAESILFVANTGDDRVIQIPVSAAGTPGAPSVFVNSINGADGLFLDDDDNVWVAANQSDEIVVVDPSGKVIAKLGDFGGLDNDAAPVGLLFPASPARHGNFVYVTNLSLDIRLFGLPQAVDSRWAEQVKTNTISRLRFRIPPVRQ